MSPAQLQPPAEVQRQPEAGPPRAALLSGRGVGVAMLIGASVLWSLSGVALKIAQVDPIGFAFWRSLAAGLGLLIVLPMSRGARPSAPWMALAVVLHAAVVTLLLKAMASDTAASGIFLQYTGPVFCALFAWLFQGRRIEPRTTVALVIAMAGVGVMLIGGLRAGSSAVGLTTGAISGVAFGALILTLEVVSRSGAERRAVNPVLIVTLNNLGTAVIVLPIALIWGELAFQPRPLSLVCATGIVQLAIPYLLFVSALRRVEPVDASLLILLEPVLNPVWVWLAVGETPNFSTFVGGIAILLAMLIEATKGKRGTQD